MRRLMLLGAAVLASCGSTTPEVREPAPPRRVTITIVGTNDLHGHVGALPVLAGYVSALRELRAQDGAVVLLDGGDMFQGTLESNLLEGAPVVEAYDAIGYDAVTIGNHEFDYGPVGERVTPTEPGDDPRGALLARAAQARYPFLAANLRTREGSPIEWANVQTAVLLERAGIQIGVIGVTTEDTLSTTNAANVSDLSMAPTVEAITHEAQALRARGAALVLVAAHAGGRCAEHDDPHDLTSCEADQEIFEVANALAPGTVDAIVAGHTHQAVSHFVHGIPIVESYSYGRAFGRVDLVVDPDEGVVDVTVHPPQDLCVSGSVDEVCTPGTYEGHAIAADPAVAAIIAPAVANAADQRARPLGVTIVGGPIEAIRETECSLGNLFTDLMRASRGTDAALTNGGGLRADLPAGPLTYGSLYTASPFDNASAIVRMTRAELEAMIEDNLRQTGSFYSLSGLRATARCEGGALRAHVTRDDGAAIADDATLTVATTDFLATGTDAHFEALRAREGAVTLEHGVMVREEMARVLEARGGELTPLGLFDPSAPRVRYEGTRPLTCP
ncbi:MAG: 5'-nucleotidase C-terminal domain-containing protein [Sandaracinaceae bacterium]|nr:5'-nucleotidase C-terminal domain-containing protein [Sandaracinaceae bacterium]